MDRAPITTKRGAGIANSGLTDDRSKISETERRSRAWDRKLGAGYLGRRITGSMIAVAIESAPRRSGNSDPRFPFHGTRGSADKPVAF
jgi:hypothetical protein